MSSDHTNYFHEKQKIVNSAYADVSLFFEAAFDPTKDANDNEALNFSKDVGGLIIPTGADEITWGYGLNTKRIPTYGGEVVQILSMYADKMTIKGTCRTYNEMNKIYEFFKKYIEYTTGAKGLDTQRHQKFLKFRYPARGWSFVIMVDDISSMRMAKDVAAPVWSLTAEIVSENDRYALGTQRADKWASALNQPMVDQAVRSGGSYGPKNFKLIRDGDPYGDQMSAAERRGKIAANFDALVASWATGDINTLRTNPLVDPAKTAEEIWTQNFGDYAGSSASGAAGGGSDVGGTTPTGASSSLGGTLTAVQIAALAAVGLKAAGFENKSKDRAALIEATKIAYGESGWNTRSINYNGSSGGQESYDAYIAGDASKAPTSSNDGNAASYDLGLWQINNYWHPEDILKACGEDTSGDYTTQRERAASKGCYKKLLDDPLANAKAMALISQGEKWSSWVAQGGAQYVKSDAEAKAGVTKYLSDPGKYDSEVSTGVPNVPMTVGRAKALNTIKPLINKTIFVDHNNDKSGFLSATGVIVGHENAGYPNDSVAIATELLECLASLGLFAQSRGWTFNISSVVGSHSRCVGGGDTPGCRESRHWTGYGCDIYQINKKQLSSFSAKQDTIVFMQALNAINPKPKQIIMYGNGKKDSDVNQYEYNDNDGRPVKGPAGFGGTGSETHTAHDDHIHIGY